MLILADVNTSIGVILMMVAITLLVVFLIALALIEAAAEHDQDRRSRLAMKDRGL